MSYIRGTYSKQIFNNNSNGFTVGLLNVKENDFNYSKKSIHFVGNFYDLRYKTNYIMYGEHTINPKYGDQFNVTKYEIDLPNKREELITFLASDLFPIGEATATKIVDLYKEQTLSTILEHPDYLLSIPRLTKPKIEKISTILKNYQYSSEIVIKLQEMGFSNKQALTLLNKYNNKILNIIDKNIYDLALDNDISFLDIDAIAKNINIDKLDERRIKALIIYLIEIITFDRGDTYLFIEDIYEEIIKYVPEISGEKLEYNLINLNKEGKIRIIDKKYYLKKYYDAEKYIVDRLYFLNERTKDKEKDIDKALEQLEKINNIKYDKTQKNAIKTALNNNITIITGGPGTGKTTIVKAIVYLLKEVFNAKNGEIALLAPTGRASKKLMETTAIPASTIHRYLKWDKESDTFNANEYDPNMEKYIIVDETSMIDTLVMQALFKGTTRNAKYIFVGDYYQLPSVSQGQILKDIIDSELIDTIKLNCLYRQNEESYIVTLANEIRNKEISENFIEKKDDYNFIETSPENVLKIIDTIIDKAMEKGYNDRDIQILAPMYKTLNGVDSLNRMLQQKFNPRSPYKNEITLAEVIYREGDKVLQLVNDNENNVYNGDIGYIDSIVSSKKSKSKKNEIIVNYDGNYVTYTPAKYINITHGYAISVHKSQGGEYKMVIMPVVSAFKRMLYNKLVYTAVTRAKNTLILVGDRSAFLYGVNNDYLEERKTTIKEFLENKYTNTK